ETEWWVGTSELQKGEEYWDKIPFVITGVHWSAVGNPFGGGGRVTAVVNLYGGRPPYVLTAKDGNNVVFSANSDSNSYQATFDQQLRGNVYPNDCRITIVDAAGNSDTVMLPNLASVRYGAWVRAPWYQAGLSRDDVVFGGDRGIQRLEVPSK